MSSFTCYCSLLSTTLLQVLPSIDLFETKTRHILLDVTRNLRHLTIGNDFNESLLDITLPNSLQHGDGQRLFQFGLSAVPLPCCTHTHIYIHICIHIQYWNMFFRCIIQQVWSNWDTIDTHTHTYIYIGSRLGVPRSFEEPSVLMLYQKGRSCIQMGGGGGGCNNVMWSALDDVESWKMLLGWKMLLRCKFRCCLQKGGGGVITSCEVRWMMLNPGRCCLVGRCCYVASSVVVYRRGGGGVE